MKRFVYTILFVVLSYGFCNSQAYSNCKWDSIFDTLARTNDDSLRMVLWDSIGCFHSNVDTVMKYSQKLYKLSSSIGDSTFMAKSLAYIAWGYYHKGKNLKAIEYLNQSIELVIDNPELKTFVAGCYLVQSYAYYNLGDFEKADKICRKASEIYNLMGKPQMISEAYRTLALFCMEYNFYESASQYLDKAYTIDSGKYFQNEIADLMYYGLIDYNKYYSECRKDVNNLYSAVKRLRESFEMSRNLNDDDLGVSTGVMQGLGNAYLALSEHNGIAIPQKCMYADSVIYFSRLGFDFLKSNGYGESLMSLDILTASAYISKNCIDSASPLVQKLIRKFKSNPESERVYGDEYYNLMYKYCKATNNFKDALQYYELRQKVKQERFLFDLTTKVSEILALENYQKFLKDYDNRAYIHNEIFKQEQEMREKLNIGLLVVIIVVLILCALNYLNKRVAQQTSKRLAESNQAIACQNEELKNQQEEFFQLRKEYERERQELELHKKKFIKANRYIVLSLEHARQFQNVLMPSKVLMEQIFGDCMVYWKPLQIVSGDFYWAIQILDVKVLVVADCTGHGVPGAFMSMLGISSLSNIVTARNVHSKEFSAAYILENIRRKVIKVLHQDNNDSEQYDSMDMAVVVLRDMSTDVEFAGANRPIIIASSDGADFYETDDMPAGYGLRHYSPFTNNIIECQPGDAVYLYSDGITDQFGGNNGRTKFGDRRLKELIDDMYQLPFNEQTEKLQDAFFQWTTQQYDTESIAEVYSAQLDDQIMVGIRVK